MLDYERWVADLTCAPQEVLDYERWVADLSEANRRPEKGPRWRRQMSAAARYRLKNLSPRQWSRMVKKMLVFGRIFSKYYRYIRYRRALSYEPSIIMMYEKDPR